MAVNFDEETYGQRWQVETVMYMLKQQLGVSISARTDGTRQREMALIAITHNNMIVLPEELFYKASTVHFPLPGPTSTTVLSLVSQRSKNVR